MVIYDLWHADDGFSVQGEELDGDVRCWPRPKNGKSLTLRLEELTHFDVSTRIEARSRNLLRMQRAKERQDINHLEVHYTCCIDAKHRKAIEDLLLCDTRKWISFTMNGVNGIADLYARPAPLEDLGTLFMALRSVEILNLNSSPCFRGHGLDAILKTIPFYSNLRELRLQGWQLDRVSVDSLGKALQDSPASKISLLSMRSCAFLGNSVFNELLEILETMAYLKTLNLSYCNLQDWHIMSLVQKLKAHESLQCLHIGGNECLTPASVQAVADWVGSESCNLYDLNLRALWVSYSEEGLLRRPVDFSCLYNAIARNTSLRRLIFSENYVEDEDMVRLVDAFVQKGSLAHVDVGENPFSEKGALVLLDYLKRCPSLESVRFENLCIPYQCADAIKMQARVHFFEQRISSAGVPLSLWPAIFSHLHNGNGDSSYTNDDSPDLIYHFLQTTTGDNGLPLSFRIAAAGVN